MGTRLQTLTRNCGSLYFVKGDRFVTSEELLLAQGLPVAAFAAAANKERSQSGFDAFSRSTQVSERYKPVAFSMATNFAVNSVYVISLFLLCYRSC